MPIGFKYILRDSLFVTFVCTIIVLTCCMLSDGLTAPIQAMGGLTAEQIHNSQNMTIFQKHPFGIFCCIIAIFVLCVIMLSYLDHGESCERQAELKRKTNNWRY